jgi:hypothetical protein
MRLGSTCRVASGAPAGTSVLRPGSPRTKQNAKMRFALYLGLRPGGNNIAFHPIPGLLRPPDRGLLAIEPFGDPAPPVCVPLPSVEPNAPTRIRISLPLIAPPELRPALFGVGLDRRHLPRLDRSRGGPKPRPGKGPVQRPSLLARAFPLLSRPQSALEASRAQAFGRKVEHRQDRAVAPDITGPAAGDRLVCG